MKVLVLDDDFHIQRIVEDRLKAENFDVLKASDGIEGLRLIYDFRPNVVLLDIMMPTIDGHAVLHCIKKDEKIKNIPVIMLTAKRERADVMQAAASGAADYIVKPIDFRLMIKKIYEVSHAAPPTQKQPQGSINVRAMAEDLANLSFEMDAVVASAGVPDNREVAERQAQFTVKVETSGAAAIVQLVGVLRPTDMEAIESEVKRLMAVGRTKFILDVTDLQSLDIPEVMLLKDILDHIAVNRCERRLVETDARRRRFLRQCNMQLEHPLFDDLTEALHSFETS